MAYTQNNSQGRNDRVRFDLIERIGVLSRKDNGWSREVNIVSWNDGAAKVDIREWDPDHRRMTKGVTLFEEEAERLTKVLARRYGLVFRQDAPEQRFFDDRQEYAESTAAAPPPAQHGRSFGELTAAPPETPPLNEAACVAEDAARMDAPAMA